MSPYPTEIPERTRRGRFVTLSQQAFALAVVVAVLTPAARTVTMEVRPAEPDGIAAGGVALQTVSAPAAVPNGVVNPTVTEYPLTASAAPVNGRVTLRGSARALATGGESVTSDALPVEGYGTVGVTWAHGENVADDAIKVSVRTQTGGTWSGWTDAEYHDDHAPDLGSAEDLRTRPGTEAILVGDVDQVQVKVDTEAQAPADLEVAVVDPGTPADTEEESPSLDGDAPVPATQDSSDGDIALQSVTTGPVQPAIYSRAQWGAPEDPNYKPKYGTINAGFVHHTVNANDYAPEDVPAILRGIWKYHVKTRGWADIGYNFLVDRFGRIWEGRAGGIDKPVIGAHTKGYNQYSFAMSAIGNFETVQPTQEMLNAYGALFAWKLSISGVDPTSMSQQLGSKTFAAINGHRDAGKTACPGKYLYAQIPAIRALAAQTQQSALQGRLENNYIGTASPDVVVRNAKSGRLLLHEVDRSGGAWKITATVKTSIVVPWAKHIIRAGDWDNDGFDDIIAIRRRDGAPALFRGLGAGTFDTGQILPGSFAGVKMLAAVGDVTGDDFPDLMGQPKGGQMQVYPGQGLAGFLAAVPATAAVPGKKFVPVGRWSKDGVPDAVVADGTSFTLYAGIMPGSWATAKTMKTSSSNYSWMVGLGPMSDGTNLLVVRDKKTKSLYALPKLKAKKFGAPVFLAKGKKYDRAG